MNLKAAAFDYQEADYVDRHKWYVFGAEVRRVITFLALFIIVSELGDGTSESAGYSCGSLLTSSVTIAIAEAVSTSQRCRCVLNSTIMISIAEVCVSD